MKKICLWCALLCGICSGYDNFKAAYDAGCKAFRAKNYADAIKIQDEAVKLAKKSRQTFQARMNASLAAIRLKNYPLAKKLAQEAQACSNLSNYSKATVNLRLGDIANYQRDRKTANKYYEEAARVYNQGWTYFSALGSLSQNHYILRNNAEAIKYAQQVIDDPKSTDNDKYNNYRRLFLVALREKKWAEAEKFLLVCEKLVKSPQIAQQSVPVVYYMRGNWYQEQKKYREAIEYFDKAIKHPQTSSYIRNESINLQALCYFYLKEYQKARKVINTAQPAWKWVKNRIDRACTTLNK